MTSVTFFFELTGGVSKSSIPVRANTRSETCAIIAFRKMTDASPSHVLYRRASRSFLVTLHGPLINMTSLTSCYLTCF